MGCLHTVCLFIVMKTEILIGSEICCLPSKYFTLRLPRIHTKKIGTWSQDHKIPVSRPEMNLTVFDLDHVNQWLAFLVLSMIFVFKRITDMETGCYRMTGLKSLFFLVALLTCKKRLKARWKPVYICHALWS